MELQKILGDYQAFVRNLVGQVQAAGFDLNDFVQMDHLCYRTTSEEGYQQKKTELAQIATLAHETTVSGRLIATYRLQDPIIVDNWRGDAIEIPAPKEGRDFAEGLEHAEFVLYDGTFDYFLKKYAGKQFGLKSATRGINPEVVYQLDGCAVKFHLLSLLTVVYLENKLKITEVK